MILEIISVGLIVSACLALFLDEMVYSVAALAGNFLFHSNTLHFKWLSFCSYFPVCRRCRHISNFVLVRRNVR